MRAKELIKLLKKDPEAEVIVTTSNFEQGQSSVELEHVVKWRMKKVSKQFRDAFDHGNYYKDVYELNEDGKEVFVLH